MWLLHKRRKNCESRVLIRCGESDDRHRRIMTDGSPCGVKLLGSLDDLYSESTQAWVSRIIVAVFGAVLAFVYLQTMRSILYGFGLSMATIYAWQHRQLPSFGSRPPSDQIRQAIEENDCVALLQLFHSHPQLINQGVSHVRYSKDK